VYSGDARNSGALDPNVRGIQGQERVPVTVDGTEQALTVWRGYNGANNRNYIDPNLISSIEVEKSASLTGDVKTSVGGGIAIKTIGIDDVVAPGEEFGMSLKLETSSNSKRRAYPTGAMATTTATTRSCIKTVTTTSSPIRRSISIRLQRGVPASLT
jgi:hemoglobin/transferrin/lactoferrin receptor protein